MSQTPSASWQSKLRRIAPPVNPRSAEADFSLTLAYNEVSREVERSARWP